MKKYYEGHEGVYKQLEAEGVDCWGRDDFENVYMLPFLEQALDQISPASRQQAHALVIGCGTGPLACVLAKREFIVSAFDISPTAIEMAKQQARERGLEINYWVGDICGEPLLTGQYDLIVDSHCLHCVVTIEDRKTAFTSICQALTPTGFFVLETMMGRPTNQDVTVDKEGIVWSQYGQNKPDFEPSVQRDGVWYVPQRRLLPNKDALDAELRSHGFEILWSHGKKSEDDPDGGDYQAICQQA